MSLESAMKNLTIAIETLTVALSNISPPASDPVVKHVEKVWNDAKKDAAQPEITIDDIRKALLEYMNKNGEEAAAKMLKKHKAAKLSDIPESAYAALMEELK